MSDSALKRFESSMAIGYEEWHDGIGYDLDALDAMSDSEKQEAERMLVPRAGNDWRDLEALDRLGTPAATAAILRVRQADDPDMRLRAHQFGPAPSTAEWDAAIVALLEGAEVYGGLTQALDCAIAHPSEAVKSMLWSRVKEAGQGAAYHCASALCVIGGIQESEYDDTHRPLFLRLVGPESDDRAKAVQELQELLKA